MGLIFLIWMVYMLWFAPKPDPSRVPPPDQARSAETAQDPDTSVGWIEQAAVPGLPAESEPVETSVPVDTVVVSSDLYEYAFITRGGLLVRAELKNYPSFTPDMGRSESGEHPPVQLVPPESRFLYTRLLFDKPSREIELGSRNFTPDRRELRLSQSNPEGSIAFTDTLAGGVTIRIVYSFRNDSYLVDSDMYLPPQLHGREGNVVEVSLGPSLLSNEKKPDEDYNNYKVIYYNNGDVVEKSLKDLTKSDWTPSGEHRILWGGLKSQYFIATFFVPEAPMTGMGASGNLDERRIAFRGRFPIPQAQKPVRYSFYLGPQAYDQITKLNYGLPKIFEYGWVIIQPFTKMALRIMLWMHQYVTNYALILVLFALMVKVVFYPLTIKSTKSQIKMQQIQPLMTEMRERFKDDPRKQQEEMLRLYREHKVNPLGGCLPLLVQMPVLFALFFVFQRTIELRGAEAFLWIRDLSQPDPYYVLPVLMGATTYLQQKLSPMPVDPKMKPMMVIMPFFMVFIFLNFSSGLVLYYTIFNVIQIFQQMYIHKRYHAPVTAVAAAAGGGGVKVKASGEKSSKTQAPKARTPKNQAPKTPRGGEGKRK